MTRRQHRIPGATKWCLVVRLLSLVAATTLAAGESRAEGPPPEWAEVQEWVNDCLLGGSRFTFSVTTRNYNRPDAGPVISRYAAESSQRGRARVLHLRPVEIHPDDAGLYLASDVIFASRPGRGLVVSHKTEGARLYLGYKEPEEVAPLGIIEAAAAFRLLSEEWDTWLPTADSAGNEAGRLGDWEPESVHWQRVGDLLLRHEIIRNTRFGDAAKPVTAQRWIYLDPGRGHVPVRLNIGAGDIPEPTISGYDFEWSESPTSVAEDPATLNGHRLEKISIAIDQPAEYDDPPGEPGTVRLLAVYEHEVESAEMLDDAGFEAAMNPPVPDDYYGHAMRGRSEFIAAQPAEMATLTAEKAATRPTLHRHDLDAPHHRAERWAWVGYAVIPAGLVVAVAVWRWKAR